MKIINVIAGFISSIFFTTIIIYIFLRTFPTDKFHAVITDLAENKIREHAAKMHDEEPPPPPSQNNIYGFGNAETDEDTFEI